MREKTVTDLILNKFMKKHVITDLDLQALADNQLSEEERNKMLAVLERDDSMRKRYEELLHLKGLVQYWWTQGARDH